MNSGSDWSSISEGENDAFIRVLEEPHESSVDKVTGGFADNAGDLKNGVDLQASSILGNVEPLCE